MSLPFPNIRRPSEVAWRLRSLTQTHQSPLDGTTQTLRQPGERWAATIAWPALVDPDRRVLEAFLAQLGGRAGRFLYGPVHAPRRATGASGRVNWIPNAVWSGAAVGVNPTGWTFETFGSVAVSVTATGSDATGAWIEISCSGTPPGAPACFLRPFFASAAPAAQGQSWTGAITVQTIGSLTNIGQIRPGVYDATGTSYTIGSVGTGNPAGLGSPTRRSVTRTIGAGVPFVGFGLDIRASPAGATISLVLRLYAPQLERASSASAFIATTSGPANSGEPPVIHGAGQSGTTLATRGWFAAADAMRAGDFLAYTDTLGRRRLHLVTADATASEAGLASLAIAPPLRRAGADGAPIDVTSPTGVFMLAEDETTLTTRPPLRGAVTLEMIEALT